MKKQKTYRVVWKIEVDAESPLDAAQQVYDLMRGPDSTPTIFTVIDGTTETRIDISEHHAPCDAFGKTITSGIGCPNGNFVCRECFDNGSDGPEDDPKEESPCTPT